MLWINTGKTWNKCDWQNITPTDLILHQQDEDEDEDKSLRYWKRMANQKINAWILHIVLEAQRVS